MDAVDVSVLLITHNHAAFVRMAVDSVLRQRTGRDWELIVSDDASEDATLQIVRDAVQDDPRVRYLTSRTNLHSNETVARALRAARGRYVCMIDGDDYWIVDDKLERQAAVLDDRADVAACFHNALVVHGDSTVPSERRWTSASQQKLIGIEEIWRGNPFATCTGMLRRDALVGIGSWYVEIQPMITDWPLYVLCAEQGSLLFIDEPVGAYRLHAGGEFTGLSTRDQLAATANLYRRLDAGLERRHSQLARSGAALFFTDRAQEYVQSGAGGLARRCLWYALRTGHVGTAVSWRRWLGLLGRTGR